jgi:cell division protein FtsB
VGRVALLATFCGILILYVGPARSWYSTWRQEKAHTAEVKRLRAENRRLRDTRRLLSRPATLERAARELGMVRRGERAFVVRGLPGGH